LPGPPVPVEAGIATGLGFPKIYRLWRERRAGSGRNFTSSGAALIAQCHTENVRWLSDCKFEPSSSVRRTMRLTISLITFGILLSGPVSAKHWHENEKHWKEHAKHED